MVNSKQYKLFTNAPPDPTIVIVNLATHRDTCDSTNVWCTATLRRSH